jgi:ADP-ribosylglycohydrolase
MSTNYSYDHAYGALVGGAIGDAAGAVLEFYRGGTITEEIAKNAMKMPGGGQLRVAPAQTTDDFELQNSLIYGLKDCNPNNGFPADKVANAYIDWIKSGPFDIGRTCAKAFGIHKEYNKNNNNLTISEYMMKNALEYNIESEANGALMRVCPIAIWTCQMPIETIAEYARADARLSHPNKVCQDCNAVYCIAIAHLIMHPGDADGAIQLIEDYVIKSPTHIHQRVHDWVLIDSKLPFTQFTQDVSRNIGWIKHGFILAIYFLRNKTKFEDAIMKTIMLHGDTDTNACIVGGLLGAYWGEPVIPLYMKVPVLNFDCTKVGIVDDVYYARTHTVVPRPKKNVPWDTAGIDTTGLGYNRPATYSTKDLYKKCNNLLGLNSDMQYAFRDTKTYLQDNKK